MAATADRTGSVPLALAAVTAQKWVFQPADPAELAAVGLRSVDAPTWCPGRFVDAAARVEAQCGRAADLGAAVAALAGRWPPARRPAPRVGTLPACIRLQ